MEGEIIQQKEVNIELPVGSKYRGGKQGEYNKVSKYK